MHFITRYLVLSIVLMLFGFSPNNVIAASHDLTSVREAAEGGDPQAQFSLGLRYLEGNGVQQDFELARNWWLKAAEQGHAKAQVNLGVMYEQGAGVTKDDQQALAWYRKSAKQGYAPAQLNIGMNYLNGRGVSQDDKQAVTWFRKSAEQGNSMAQYNLGFMYAIGRGIEKNGEQAISWWTKSANQGEVRAQYNLGVIFDEGTDVPQDLKKAAFWYSKAADQGNAEARAKIALIEAKNDDLPQDDKIFVDSNSQVSDQGAANTEDQFNLIVEGRYISLLGVPKFRWGFWYGAQIDMKSISELIKKDLNKNPRLTIKILNQLSYLSRDKEKNSTRELMLSYEHYIYNGISYLDYREEIEGSSCMADLKQEFEGYDTARGPTEESIKIHAKYDKCNFYFGQSLPTHLTRKLLSYKQRQRELM